MKANQFSQALKTVGDVTFALFAVTVIYNIIYFLVSCDYFNLLAVLRYMGGAIAAISIIIFAFLSIILFYIIILCLIFFLVNKIFGKEVATVTLGALIAFGIFHLIRGY